MESKNYRSLERGKRDEMYTVSIVEPGDRRVQRLKEHLLNMPALTAQGVVLFEGGRWYDVEAVALLEVFNHAAGMATLAPTNELGAGGPHLIALWIDPEISISDRVSYGISMLRSLAEEAQRRYGATTLTWVTATQTERMVAREGQAQGIVFIWRDGGGKFAPAW